MLPDKNELNDELVEQISGGLEDVGLIKPGTIDSFYDDSPDSTEFPEIIICPNCGNKYFAYKESADGFCPECRPEPLKTEISIGNINTAIPGVSNKDGLVKIH